MFPLKLYTGVESKKEKYRSIIKKEPGKFPGFEAEINLFPLFFDKEIKDNPQFCFSDNDNGGQLQTRAKLMIYLFFLWLDIKSDELELMQFERVTHSLLHHALTQAQLNSRSRSSPRNKT